MGITHELKTDVVLDVQKTRLWNPFFLLKLVPFDVVVVVVNHLSDLIFFYLWPLGRSR